MAKIIKYSLLLLLIIILIVGVIYYAYFKKDLKVIFNSNGGSVVASMSVNLDGQINEPSVPTKSGYTFDGWYLNNEKFNFNTVIDENITLIAHWVKNEEKSYIIKFDTLGGTNIENLIVLEGHILEKPVNPIKDGYEFICWQYHNKEYDFSNPITNDMVLVAKYKKLEEIKTSAVVTFDSNGGSKIDSEIIHVGGLVKMPKDPVRDGYQFVGWYLDEKEFNFLDAISEDITLEAHWVKSKLN